MAADPKPRHYTVEEYLELDDNAADAKYEYIDGQIYLMSGGTMDHWRISFNIGTALDSRLRRDTCQFYGSDVRVQVSATRYLYPDMSVTCNPTERGRLHTVKSPLVIFEVLSPSNEKSDRVQKARYYRACPTIQEYVLVDAQRMYVEVDRRAEVFWQLFSYEKGAVITLASLEIAIPIEEFYRQIELEPEEDD